MDFSSLSGSTQAILRDELAIMQKRIQVREDDCRIALAEAVLNGDDAHIESLLLPIRELTAVRKSLAAAQPMLLVAPPPPASVAPPTPHPKPYGLCITISGSPVRGWTDVSAFANAIQHIGCEKVAALGLTLNYLPLVAKEFRRLARMFHE